MGRLRNTNLFEPHLRVESSPLPTPLNRQDADRCRHMYGPAMRMLTGYVGRSAGSHGECAARLWYSRRLAESKDKDCAGSLARALSPACELGRLAQMLRECAPDDVHAGGASVVVRGRESRSHGEGRQLKWFA